LYNWNERIRILPGAGLFEGAINDADLDALFLDARPHIEAVARDLGQPTEFEVVTFLGLWHFARQSVDAAVIEVGLGGKWDATNVTEPLVSVVTHVALDHMDRLGNTLEEIAADKVCIARAGRPFITAEWKPEVLEVFRSHRKLTNDDITIYREQKIGEDTNFRLAYLTVQTFCQQAKWKNNLPKRVPKWNEYGWKVPGRREFLEPNLIIDGANNPEGAEFLRDFVELQLMSRKYAHTTIDRENLILVLGILADKDWQQMTQILAPLAKKVIVTQSNSPRAATASQIGEIARRFCLDVEEIVPVAAAVERAKLLASPDDTILVTGSFTTIAEVPRPDGEL
ncbi:MAG TPA: hypothetical protein VF627_11685, partial [Abditibacterium sp.]